ncbi:DUF4214 domain-containing protein [Methylobacterium sp. P31]
MWATDGTSAGTHLLDDINPGTAASLPGQILSLGNGQALFSADDGTHGNELWITDGTTAGTHIVSDINPGGSLTPMGTSSPNSSYAADLTALGNGRVVFRATDAAHGIELWVSDSTAAGTHIVSDINPGVGYSVPSEITAIGNGKAVFSAYDGTATNLWVTDGTAAGTHVVAGTGAAGGLNPTAFFATEDGRALFSANDGTHGSELWITDGTSAGTHLVDDINADPSVHAGNSNPNGFVALPTTPATLFGTMTTDPHGAGGQVYALFEGILGRAPDASGLEYYANQIAHGVAPASLAANFLASPEGQARLGAADNTTFIQQLYQNTLHRAADSAGLQYHLDELAHGVSRVQVADNFVFSPEFTNTVQQAISSGLFVPDANASEVARLYYTMLGRAPDAIGLTYWTDKLAHGGSASDLAQGFLNSPENQATYGKLSNSAYVDALYVNALGRHAESNGLAYWTAHLDQGESRADLAVQLSQSAESQTYHFAQIEQGYHLA